MQALTPISRLAGANQAHLEGDAASAMAGYLKALQQMPELGSVLWANIARVRQQYQQNAATAQRPKAVVCGWELAHNAAGRAHTLAGIYRAFADVEIVGCILPQYGHQVWEPVRSSNISIDAFVAQPGAFMQQATQLVARHPAQVVHLTKPRGPNILFGALYKHLWGAQVLMDIDEEELAFVDAETPLALDEYLQTHGQLPPDDQLGQADWTRLAVGLCHEFDGITVSNTALQTKYGGEVIGHARDPKQFSNSPALRQRSRKAHGIADHHKVVMFAGSPRPHKGLLQVAQALHTINNPDILFVIAGSFGANYQWFKQQLLAVEGVNYIFLENLPFEELPKTLAMADCCVLMQDVNHPWSQYQIPAKLTDALAMRIPLVVTATPALAEAVAHGVAFEVDAENLPLILTSVLAGVDKEKMQHAYRYFLQNLSLDGSCFKLQSAMSGFGNKNLTFKLKKLSKFLQH
jgi:glycosyltransferase involved in cell wall biosynthesis